MPGLIQFGRNAPLFVIQELLKIITLGDGGAVTAIPEVNYGSVEQCKLRVRDTPVCGSTQGRGRFFVILG